MGELYRRLYYLIHRRRLDAELERDMEFHREMAAQAGHPNFGNMLRMREQAREAWGWVWLDRLWQDLRFAARLLVSAPGFTVMAVLILAIGIGVNVAAFSLFDMVALQPLPVRDPGSLVRLERRSPHASSSEMPYPSVQFYGEHAKTLSAAIAVLGIPPMQVDDDVQPASASFFTANYFSELGTTPAYGRLFDPERESLPNGPPVVVLSYGFWQKRYGADPSVVGRTIRLDKKPATILGIAPYALATLGGQGPDLWLPMAQQPYFVEGSHILTDPGESRVRMWGRLEPGVSMQAAAQELRTLTDELRHQHPKDIWDGEYIDIHAGGHLQVMQPEMYQVAAMVALLTLLILAVSCTNLGGLMLARAVTREREMGIRMAIGASRWRIFRQLCTESVLLAALGATAGLAAGCAVLRVTLTLLDAPKWLSAVPDWRVLLFTLGMTFFAAGFFGLAPALQIARQRQHKTLLRQVLVGAQIAASCVLMIVAGLLVRATQHVLFTDPGFGYQRMVSIDPQLRQHGYTPVAAKAYLDQMQAKLRALPGVQSVSLVQLPPMGHVVDSEKTETNGRTVLVYPNWVDPGYFETMRIPFVLGRTFYPNERNAVVVSESFARKQWPGQNPLGQRLGDGDSKDIVIGVVGNARVNALNDDDATEQYWPSIPDAMATMAVIARTEGSPGSLAPVVKSISENLDPKVLPEIRLLRQLYDDKVAPAGKLAAVVSVIGTVAVVLAGIGIVGLVAFTVSQRLKEIAIRIALGARDAQVLSMVLHQFVWPVAIGMIAGTGMALACTKLLRRTLYGVNNLDPVSYGVALAVLFVLLLLAGLVPARRALRLDLARALHYD